MSDQSAEGEVKNTDSHAEASLVPETNESTSQEAKAAMDEVVETAHAAAPAPRIPSKEITLQRLTPHSSWEDYVFNDKAEQDAAFTGAKAPKAQSSRLLPIAAIVALAASVGAIGGALATVGLGHFTKTEQPAIATAANLAEQGRVVEGAIAKLNADLAALKSSSAAQSSKIVERIDRVEKAQAEPTAKLAKLSEAVDKLRSTEATGSTPQAAAAATPTATPAPNRLPRVDGWVLRDVADGVAMVEGRQGVFEVIPGDPLPGVGRVDAIRRQDGRWVVVTSRGLIVSR